MSYKQSEIIEPNFDGGVIESLHVKGGFRIVRTVSQLLSIKFLYRTLNDSEATIVFVREESAFYQLLNNPVSNTTLLSDWKRTNFGTGATNFKPVGTWDADNDDVVLTDVLAANRNGEFYFVTNAVPPRTVSYAGLFKDEAVIVADGNLIVSVGDSWAVITPTTTWDSIAKPQSIIDYVNGIVIAHNHEISQVNGLLAALASKFDSSFVADSSISFGSVPNSDIVDVEFLRTHYYTKSEVDSLIGFGGGGGGGPIDWTDGYSTYDLRYPLLSGSYANPSWISSLPFSKITSTPTTAGGYGITDVLLLSGGTLTGNLLFSAGANLDTVATGGSDVLNIGTANADIINIGSSTTVVNIQGSLIYQNVTNLEVKDKLIRLNKGGAAASGSSSGFEIEEGGSVTGWFTTTGSRNGFEFRAPSIGFSANLLLSSLTAARSFTLPDFTGTFLVSGGDNANNLILKADAGNALTIKSGLGGNRRILFDDTFAFGGSAHIDFTSIATSTGKLEIKTDYIDILLNSGNTQITLDDTDNITLTGGNNVNLVANGAAMYISGATDVSIASGAAIGLSASTDMNFLSNAASFNINQLFLYIAGTGTNGQVLTMIDNSTFEVGWTTPSGGGTIAGGTGSIDNALIRADGTGGSTIQSSPIIISDTGDIQLGTGSIVGPTRIFTVSGSDTDISYYFFAKGNGEYIWADQAFQRYLQWQPSSGSLFFGGTSTVNKIRAAFGNVSTPTGADMIVSGGDAYNVGNNNGGNLYLIGGALANAGKPGNVGFHTVAGSFGGGKNVMFIGDATDVPSTSISNGGVLSVDPTTHLPSWFTGTSKIPMTNPFSTQLKNSTLRL